MDLQRRVERLEKQNHVWRALALFNLTVMIVAVYLLGQGPASQAQPESAKAAEPKKLLVQDEKGKAVITGSGLVFYDAATGKMRANIGKTGLFVYNDKEMLQAALYCSSDHAEMRLWSEKFDKDKSLILLRVNDEKGATLHLSDRDGKAFFSRP